MGVGADVTKHRGGGRRPEAKEDSATTGEQFPEDDCRDEQGAELEELDGAKDPQFETCGRHKCNQEPTRYFRPSGKIHAGGLRDAARDGGERHRQGDARDPGLPNGPSAARSATDQPGEGDSRGGGKEELQDEIQTPGDRELPAERGRFAESWVLVIDGPKQEGQGKGEKNEGGDPA